MKIQKRFLRKYIDKDYYKFMINIPPEVLKESGLKYGEEIEVCSKDDKIILKKKSKK